VWRSYALGMLAGLWALNASGQNGAARIVYPFGTTNGLGPINELCIGPDGNYYGATERSAAALWLISNASTDSKAASSFACRRTPKCIKAQPWAR